MTTATVLLPEIGASRPGNKCSMCRKAVKWKGGQWVHTTNGKPLWSCDEPRSSAGF